MTTVMVDRLQARIAEIQERVAAFYGTSVQEIVRGTRHARCVEPRHVAIGLAYQAGASHQMLAAAFHKDRTTVIHSIERSRGCVPPELRYLGHPVAVDAPPVETEAQIALESGLTQWPEVSEEPLSERRLEKRLNRIERQLDRLISLVEQRGLRGVA